MKKAATQTNKDSIQHAQGYLSSTSNVSAANKFGLVVDFIEKDGQLRRVATQSKPNSKNGWYVAHDDILIMGDWVTGIVETFKSDGLTLTRDDKEEIRKSIKHKKLEKIKLQHQTAELSREQYLQSESAVYHPYLNAKGINPVDGLKIVNNQLIVPLYDLKTGLIKNLQRIYPDGSKRFLKNGQVTGLCFPCGLLNHQMGMPKNITELYICEGFATAASMFQITGWPVLASMNAGNLLAISKLAKSKWPNADIVIAGDDDWLTHQKYGTNPGKEKAIEAANAIGANVSIPPFTAAQHMNGLTDWNDYWLDSNSGAVI
jgi:putative DNA primase/helicase